MSFQIKSQFYVNSTVQTLLGGRYLDSYLFGFLPPTQTDTKWWRLKRQLQIYLLFPSVPPPYHRDLNSITHTHTLAMREAGLRVALIVMPVLCWQISTPCFFKTCVKARCRARMEWITSLFIFLSFPCLQVLFLSLCCIASGIIEALLSARLHTTFVYRRHRRLCTQNIQAALVSFRPEAMLCKVFVFAAPVDLLVPSRWDSRWRQWATPPDLQLSPLRLCVPPWPD